MTPGSNYDVVVVGAGAAGLTAAIALARAGIGVAVVEAAAYPGAENWSGCVYFCENLAHPDVLGPDGVEALAWERRLVERGFFATDGHGLLGMRYRDPDAFRQCYTVLRPVFDHHLAQVARKLGVALLAETTAESLIRERGRVIGVATRRGPLYADLVFLAEGDASHLVTREGYERFTDQRETPKFLQGIKQVIDLPPGAVEDIFGVGADEGVAYEMLVRNGTLRGKPVHLNMGGFIYTNRQSLSVGLVLPADNLKEHFDGDPNLLIEWFENLPALGPWLERGKRGVFGAKLIRGGGAKDIPTLIDDGLAIGGAASGVGVDFPYPNFTGPATAMGLQLARAVRTIRAAGGDFTRENLRRHHLEPLQRTHYWQDVEFLRRWPGYVKKTHVFFDRQIDLALGTAYVWTRPGRWFATRWLAWLRLVMNVAGPQHWPELRADLGYLVRALRLREVATRPELGRLLLDGTINALRDLAKSPRANLPAAGTVRLHYSVAGGLEPVGPTPKSWDRWFKRLAPVLASAARLVYTNDNTPLARKLPRASQLLVRQINLVDLMTAGALAVAAGLNGLVLAGWDRVLGWLRPARPGRAPRGIYRSYAHAATRASDLTPNVVPAGQAWEARLGRLLYETVKTSHIHVLWPRTLAGKDAAAKSGLWHVCPAHVYEARQNSQGQLQVVVNFENCIKCETCWRTGDLVDWGRDGLHRFVYPVASPVVPRLVHAAEEAGTARPAPPRVADHWAPAIQALADRLQSASVPTLNGHHSADLAELYGLVTRLEAKLDEFDRALAEEPRTVDRARAEYLELLARYAQQLALRVVEVLRNGTLVESAHPGVVAAQAQLLELATALAAKAEERARRTWDQRFSWAAADGRQLRLHHLVGLRRLLDTLARHVHAPAPEPDPSRAWLRAEDDARIVEAHVTDWRARLDAVFSPYAWRDLDRGVALASEQDAVLRDLVAQVPPVDANDLAHTLHPPVRKALLAELGRRDPSLAYRVASHLWCRDVAQLRAQSRGLADAITRWTRGDEWAAFAVVDGVASTDGRWSGEAVFVPAAGAKTLLLLVGDQLAVVPVDAPGLRVEPVPTLGLRGAGMARLRLDGLILPEGHVAVDPDRVRRVWQVLSAADLVSIASGMAHLLCRRAIAHATTRVQFPGLFHDEEARDPIAKFGAIKKMIAEMGARRYLLETLDHALSPADFSAPSVERAALVKALAAEALGTAPGSLSYNAGQVFGGTGYSEDDVLAKYYRDASAWRFVGAANADVYRQHGDALLRQWHPDGRRLAGLGHEALLFDQVAQRKALQAELDEIRVLRSRLRALVNDWQQARREQAAALGPVPGTTGGVAAAAELAEALARQDALLLASKAVLLRTHARLEHGVPAEAETALTRVWLAEVAAALEDFEAAVRRRLDGPAGPPDRPLVDPAAGPPVTTYAGYLQASCPYDSGDFLGTPVDLTQPRYVPEMVETDPDLAARDRATRELVLDYFGRPRDNGVPYERYIETRHRPDAQDLDFCREHGFFRMPIPRELGGEGKPKVDYYFLTTHTYRFADVGISLLIQVNSSLGTTPILLALERDLPRAQKDLAPFVADTGLHADVRKRLEALIGMVDSAAPKRVGQAVAELQARLQESVLKRTVLKTLAFRFVEAWQQAGRAVRAFDNAGVKGSLGQALAHWNDVCARAEEYHAELGRRKEACERFLRWISAGQISAFALTEPSAGSDTARVATRAVPRSVPVDRDADGVLSFVPAGGTDRRYVLDARRLDFRPEGVSFRWSDSAEPSPICFDAYDYESDDPTRKRSYQHGPRRVEFTDIAVLRERDGRLWYDYWELTGAKMWITNGRMCGVLCLYAKTEEGVTGFLVDRHAEGLVIGKDEAKLGQLGSPTNEVGLQAVRVPRENVLGLEGRGQVNALETLNVGRAGLAMSAMALIGDLVDRSRVFAQAAQGDIPDWVTWRLARMEEDRFTVEALAHEVVGRFEHPQTKEVRLESAVAKMLGSEILHRVIESAEEIHGLAGQTQLHLVEKRKRDARVLNIYEGTNEVQRFLILKELATDIAPRWAHAAALPSYLGREALELEALKADLRQRVTAALDVFGQELWQNPNLQANCFLLSEATAWLKAADSVVGRLAFLDRLAQADEGGEPSPKMDLGRRAFARCAAEVRNRLRRFDEELAHLRRGYYAPEVRAAELLFHGPQESAAPVRFASKVEAPLAVLVVVEPAWAAGPHPSVVAGRLLEAHSALSESDRAALETALRLRDAATAPVSVTVAAVGTRAQATVLREALSLGVDRVRLVVAEGDTVAPDRAAEALALLLRDAGPFDLVLGGQAEADGEEGLVARLTAEALGLPYAGRAVHVAVRKGGAEADLLLADAEGRQQRVRDLPAAVGVEAGAVLRPFTVEGYLTGLARAVETERWPKRVVPRAVLFAEGGAGDAARTEVGPGPLTPDAAARQALAAAGLGNGAPAHAPYEGPLEQGPPETFPQGTVVAVVAADSQGRLQPTATAVLRAARHIAVGEAVGATALVLTPADEAGQRRAAGQSLELFGGPVIVLSTGEGLALPDVRSRVLRECWSLLVAAPRAVVGEPWAEDAFAALARKSSGGIPVLRVRHLAVEAGQVVVEGSRARGRLRTRQVLAGDTDAVYWITLTPEAEVAPAPFATAEAPVYRWTPRLERFYGQGDIQRLLDELKQDTGLVRLADADFIIDTGYGVPNRDSYEEVIEPLERALRELGVRNLAVGGSRKVTEELHLLPVDRQIGQSGVSVNPRVLLAIGVSGAPQHLNYIGTRATILAFNRDPEAPIMTLNQRQPRPRVFPVLGNLFETVPAFVAALRRSQVDAAAPDSQELEVTN